MYAEIDASVCVNAWTILSGGSLYMRYHKP